MIAKIENALAGLGLPVFDYSFDRTKKYVGSDGRAIQIRDYITYETIYERPSLRADDEDIETEINIDVDVWIAAQASQSAKADTYKLKVRDALRSAGYIINQTEKIYEDATQYFHIVVNVTDVAATEKYTEESNNG